MKAKSPQVYSLGLCFYSRTNKRVSDKVFIPNWDAPFDECI
jgi:hypothetical protein